jgi:hypothetical protein
MMEHNSSDEQALYDAVHEVLKQVWDPVEVKNTSAIADEYASYVPEMIRLIRYAKTKDQLAFDLQHIEKTQFGIHPDTSRLNTTAAALWKLKP